MRNLLIGILLLFSLTAALGQSITGYLFDNEGNPVPFATIHNDETKQHTTSDERGFFNLTLRPEDLPLKLTFQSLGFRSKTLMINEPHEVKVTLEYSSATIDQVVVSGSRTARKQGDLAVDIDVIHSEALERVNAVALSDGLNYQCGVRVESNCQTCNFTQVRMNGLGGGYTQILINSRPIFNSLVGLYGLEQVPVSMIDRIEVLRGGGSALFGSSAIAGTINIITKRPERNEAKFGYQLLAIDERAQENYVHGLSSIVSESGRSGMSIQASYRHRSEWDANNDGYSELPRLSQYHVGASGFNTLSESLNLDWSLNGMREDRNGGDLLDEPAHQRTQSEERNTSIFTGNVDLNWEINDGIYSKFYVGGQYTDREHYTGIDGIDGYGITESHSIQLGNQWTVRHETKTNIRFENTFGIEGELESVFDEIPAYNYLIDQQTRQLGIFAQSDIAHGNWTGIGGIRIQYHNFINGLTVLPRFNIMYAPGSQWKIRAGYGRGFRAPQAFDTDLHIAFAAGGISTIQLSENLQPEFFDAFTLGLDYDGYGNHSLWGCSINTFYTSLKNAFALTESGMDVNGNLRLLKINASGSKVYGISLEGRYIFNQLLELETGFTIQENQFNEGISWSESVEGTTSYLRTPNIYGHFTSNFFNDKPYGLNIAGIYTGGMLVPHFGGAPGVTEDRLEKTRVFWDCNASAEYDFNLSKSSSTLSVSLGVMNIFNAFQSDFDTGTNRDSNYIYGPQRPRTFVLKIGLQL